METVSDLDGDLVNFWRILRDRPQDLERACALTPATLIYADPPYLESTRSGRGRGPSYIHEIRTENGHRELAAALRAARAAVVLSGYDSPVYNELYHDWHRAEMHAFTGNSTRQRDRTEVLWSNRPFPVTQPDLFDLEAS